jgi:hypothetical protein
MEETFYYKGKKFLMNWAPKDKIFFVAMKGVQKKEDANDFSLKLGEFLKKIPVDPFKILIDATQLIKSDHEARRIYTNFVKEHKSITHGRVAMCSANVFATIVGKFITIIAPKNINFKIFKTVNQGLKWLKSV